MRWLAYELQSEKRIESHRSGTSGKPPVGLEKRMNWYDKNGSGNLKRTTVRIETEWRKERTAGKN